MDDLELELELDLIDLGDAAVETKQCAPLFFLPDSTFQWGLREYTGGGPPQCP